MFSNPEEAIPHFPTEEYNCLLRNGIRTWEKLAEMTDYDIAMLKYQPKILNIMSLRDKAKYWKDSQINK